MQFLIRCLNPRGVVVNTSPLELLKKEVLRNSWINSFLFGCCILQLALAPESEEFALSVFKKLSCLGFLMHIAIFDDKPLRY